MPRVVVTTTSPAVLTRTRSKSSSEKSIDTASTKVVKNHVVHHVNEATAEILPTKKRKRAMVQPAKGKVSSTPQPKKDEEASSPSKKKKSMADSFQKEENEEKRLRRFRQSAPQSYHERLARADSQRFAL